MIYCIIRILDERKEEKEGEVSQKAQLNSTQPKRLLRFLSHNHELIRLHSDLHSNIIEYMSIVTK